jgi:hypothetical protein
MSPLQTWSKLPHMTPAQWALAWRLRHSRRWRWLLQMGEIYEDGSFRRHEGVIVRRDEPLPMLLDEPTAGRLIGQLASTGPGWDEELRRALLQAPDWREAVALALLRRWSEG